MTRKVIQTDSAPQPVGPYSQGIAASGNFVFVAGQIGLDLKTGKLADGGIEAQTAQALENLKAVLEGAGSSLANVVKTTVLLHDIGDFAVMNKVYAGYFASEAPARAAFGGLQLPAGALVEIECIALVGN